MKTIMDIWYWALVASVPAYVIWCLYEIKKGENHDNTGTN